MADDDDRFATARSHSMSERVRDERRTGDGHERLGHAVAGASEPRADACCENDGLVDRDGGTRHELKSYPMHYSRRAGRAVARVDVFMLHFPAWPKLPTRSDPPIASNRTRLTFSSAS